ncbi:cation diffusion facilitator family transporter [Thermosediminibacter litoriperuensis]|uniref:Cation diffusion facilitator family transporter n=1 Tax=Thermosediminibacter litoriperuensis TaxID=291989 RepID=A0A5S5AZ66_9FIRM|nr:cation diffusion facilitator family transporter [Thermosediminibacter litoriperuensis]TYP58751.1 cation diffusion facilitator family transporter [Thermosediminibacter litoriperuensis]
MILERLAEKLFSGTGKDEEKARRNAYAMLSGVVGIAVNALLFALKFTVGRITNSIAVSADAFNNLGDIGSSVVTIIGFKVAARPPDREHPFGHGRIEYITSLIISIIVILMGFELMRDSIGRVLNPETVEFSPVSLIILLFTVAAKLWLGKFTGRLAEKIDSRALDASSFDSYGDVISTSTATLGLLLSRFTTLPLDGYLGILVSLFIMYSGYNLVMESVDLLIGGRPDPELVEEIKRRILSYEGIIGVHDLMVHNYGPGRCVVSLHAEVPENMSAMKAHDIIDTAERELSEELGVFLTIHMDPVSVDDEEVERTRRDIEKVLREFPEVLSIHDLRVVGSGSRKNVIFDAVVSGDVGEQEEKTLKRRLAKRIKEAYPGYNPVIIIDRQYV